MHFSDEGKAENYLMNIGYHRLSAYIFPFYKSPKSDLVLNDGTTFEQVMTLYRFDKKLRIVLFNEIEKIELAIRSVLANMGCQELGDKYWITKAEYFANADSHRKGIGFKQRRIYWEFQTKLHGGLSSSMDNNRGFVFRQLELHLLQHSEQQIEKTYCRLFRAEATSIYFLAYYACQFAQYVLPPCQSVE